MVFDQVRCTGGIILQVGEDQLHIDPGPGSARAARDAGVDLRKTTVLLVSHDHLDHCNDLNLVIDAMTVGGEHKKGVLVCNGAVAKNAVNDFNKDCLTRIVTLEKGDDIKLDGVHVVATPTKNHEGAIGFRVTTQSFVLGYTADTAFTPLLAKAFEKCDILIINNALPFGMKGHKHLSSDDTLQILEHARPKLAILTHFGRELVEANPLYETREIQKRTGIQIIAATDGMVIQPESYAANTLQRNLGQFNS